MADYKGFDPTAKKLKKIRKEGQVLKCPSLAQGAALLIIFLSIFNILQYMWSISPQMLEYCFSASVGQSGESAGRLLINVLIDTVIFITLSLLIAATGANLVEFFQVGFELHWEQLCPKLDRLNPVKGFQRIFSGTGKAFFLCFKALIAIIFTIYIAVCAVKESGVLISSYADKKILALVSGISSWIYWEAALLLLIAISEYLFSRRQFINRHSMSIDDVKKEIKEEEGDPHIRANRKVLHEALVMQEIVKKVRASKVIIIDE